MKRAALYIRVSTDEQARHGYSLGEQRADLTEYAKRKRYIIVGVYADEGASARKAMSRRHELQRLLRDVEDGKIDIILIKCLDRWFRNVADFYKVKEVLDAHGVEFECTQEKINTTTAAGRLELNIRLSIAQDESDRTSERIKYVFDGKKKRREAVTGRVSLGFSIVDKKYVHNEQSEIVRYIFDAIASGKSKRDVLRCVSSEYGLQISYSKLTSILQNKMYIGEAYGIRDYIEPLIDYETFQKVQEITARNPRRARSGRIYLFSGLVICPVCGCKMTAGAGYCDVNGDHHHFYRCIKSSMSLSCSFKGCVTERVIEKRLLDSLPSIAMEYISEYREDKKDGLRDSLEVVDGKLKRLKDIYLEGIVDLDEYRKDYDDLTKLKAKYQSELAAEKKVPDTLYNVVSMDDFKSYYAVMGRAEKKAFWQSTLKRIEISEGKPRTFRYIFL